jgi:glycosyltransferase involved in cell wall biosynthesis
MSLTFLQAPRPRLDRPLLETVAERDQRDLFRPHLRRVAPGSVDVVLVTEGTYPHGRGGVSVWCDQLVNGLPDRSFRIAALTAFSHQRAAYTLPDHASELLTIGLWDGPVQYQTAGRRGIAPLASQLAALLVSPQDDAGGFLDFVDAAVSCTPEEILHRLRFVELLRALDVELRVQPSIDLDRSLAGFRVADVVQVAHMLDHLLRPLAADLGPADVYHASSNGLAALACMVARRRHGGRLLLAEHGIYLRERYLELRRLALAKPAKALLVRFHRLVSAAAYADASVVAPCNRWNQRWETRFGTRRSQLRTVYNGVDPERFPATGVTPNGVVSWLGRIDPIKDLGTLIRAFRIVRDKLPDARLKLHGLTPLGNEGYRSELERLIAELGLDDVVTFEGAVAHGAEAYAEAQLAALSSISEGFPYSIIEAMACGLPTVATGVGGVTEALADTGIVVLPRMPDLLAMAIVELLQDPERCRQLGERARQRVLDSFTLDHCLDTNRQLYRQLQGEVDRSRHRRSNHGHGRRHAHGNGARHVQGQHAPGQHGAVTFPKASYVVTSLPGIPTIEQGPVELQRPLNPADHHALVAAVGGSDALAEAIDVDEVAAAFESVGVTDQVAALRFGSPDVFHLAERVWDQPEPTAPAPPAGPPTTPPPEPPGPRRPEPWLPRTRGTLARGIAYVLPALTIGAAALRGTAQAALLTASALGWGLANGGAMLGYTVLTRSGTNRGLGPLRRGFALCVAAIVASGVVVAATTTPTAGAAFALPLLHLLAACGLVMAGRTSLLLGLLAPVTALSASVVMWPDSSATRLVGVASVATVAVSLTLVGRELAVGGGGSGARMLQRDDWVGAGPMVVSGWLSAAFILLAVRALVHVDGLAGTHDRVWLLLAVPLWLMVVASEWLLVRVNRSLQLLLHATSTIPAFRARSRWTVACWLAAAAVALQVSVLGVTAASGLPTLAAWQVSTVFFYVSMALLGVTVLCTAARTSPAIVVLAVAIMILALITFMTPDLLGAADHTAALVLCAVTAVTLCVVATRTLIDPASHR